jgi:hypothetical protein
MNWYKLAKEENNVQEAAHRAGYNIKAAHKTDASFNEFSIDEVGNHDYGYAGKGFYFTPKALSGLTYGRNTMNVYLKIDNPYKRTPENWNKDELNPYTWIPKQMEKGLSNNEAATKWTKMIQEMGYDGFIDEALDNGEIVVFKPTQIKSSDPITYDDEGNEIPLDKRFDESNPDIRY